MVTVDLIGRCGNQMFQLATGKAHALRMGVEFFSPKYSLDKRVWPKYFHNIPVIPSFLGDPTNFYKEPSHTYTPIPDYGDVKLHGYFQSEKYFKEYRDSILDLFGLQYLPYPLCVGIHVRRGDYLTMQEKHPVLPTKYYDQAISMFPGYNFKVYSDDPAWCKSFFVGSRFKVIPNSHPVQDLNSMSWCEHQIIANSSFSWWAAWLNRNPSKRVIAPKLWFGPDNAHLLTDDLIPESWITI